MTTATDVRTDDLEALDFDAEIPCDFSADECPHPAQWDLTVAIISTQGAALGHVHDILCDQHKRSIVAHLDVCPNCPRIMRIENVVGIR